MIVSQFFANLPADPVQQNLGLGCVNHRERNRLILLPAGISQAFIDEIARELDPCPPNSMEAQQIVGRFVPFSDVPLCYISGGPIRRPGLSFSFTQQCCYDSATG